MADWQHATHLQPAHTRGVDPIHTWDDGAAARAQAAELLAYQGDTSAGSSAGTQAAGAVDARLKQLADRAQTCADALAEAVAFYERNKGPEHEEVVRTLRALEARTRRLADGASRAHTKSSPYLKTAQTARQILELVRAIDKANRAAAKLRSDNEYERIAAAEDIAAVFGKAGVFAERLPGPLGTYLGGLFAMPSKVVVEFKHSLIRHMSAADLHEGNPPDPGCFDGDRVIAQGPAARAACSDPDYGRY